MRRRSSRSSRPSGRSTWTTCADRSPPTARRRPPAEAHSSALAPALGAPDPRYLYPALALAPFGPATHAKTVEHSAPHLVTTQAVLFIMLAPLDDTRLPIHRNRLHRGVAFGLHCPGRVPPRAELLASSPVAAACRRHGDAGGASNPTLEAPPDPSRSPWSRDGSRSHASTSDVLAMRQLERGGTEHSCLGEDSRKVAECTRAGTLAG